MLRRLWLRWRLRGLRLSSVIVAPNGMAAVFDDKGEQVPALQGRWSERAGDVFPFMPGDWVSRPLGAGWEYGPPRSR